MTIDTTALRQLLAAATTRPWHVEYLGEQGYPQRISNDAAVIVAETFQGPPLPAADAELIAAAVNNLLPLLDRVSELEHELFVQTNSDDGMAVLLEAALTRATGRQQALAGILDELLRGAWENGHPGYPAARTFWIRAEKVSEWRTLLPTYAAPVVVGTPAGQPRLRRWRDGEGTEYVDATPGGDTVQMVDLDTGQPGGALWVRALIADHYGGLTDITDEPKPLPRRVKGATYPRRDLADEAAATDPGPHEFAVNACGHCAVCGGSRRDHAHPEAHRG